ncbi:MAG: chromosome partitioning protein [Aeromicrobium sp.]|nr:chromosome partitioning protein [Aeromicrobium sp.]
MDLRDYLVLVARNWIILVVTMVVGLAAAGVMILIATPKYESTARVVFTAHDVNSGQDLAYAGNYVQSRMQTYKNLATSPTVMGPVVSTLGEDESTEHLAHRTTVEVSQIDTIMTIAVKDESAKTSAKAANAVAASLIGTVTKIESNRTEVQGSPTVEGVTIGPAHVESSPASPNKSLYLLAGLLVGLLISVVVIAVRQVYVGEGVNKAVDVPGSS